MASAKGAFGPRAGCAKLRRKKAFFMFSRDDDDERAPVDRVAPDAEATPRGSIPLGADARVPRSASRRSRWCFAARRGGPPRARSGWGRSRARRRSRATRGTRLCRTRPARRAAWRFPGPSSTTSRSGARAARWGRARGAWRRCGTWAGTCSSSVGGMVPRPRRLPPEKAETNRTIAGRPSRAGSRAPAFRDARGTRRARDRAELLAEPLAEPLASKDTTSDTLPSTVRFAPSATM